MHAIRHAKVTESGRAPKLRSRPRGKLLVLLAILLPTLFGVAGLVLDGGRMMSEHRGLQHAVDAAATGAAVDLRLGNEAAVAALTAEDLVGNGNGLSDAQVTVNIPPASGPFAGRADHVEVLAQRPYRTHLMRVLDGALDYELHTRAVAGVRDVTAGAAIVVLDPDPADLTISGLSDVLAATDVDDVALDAAEQSGVYELLARVPIVGPTVSGIINASLPGLLTDLIDDLWADVLGDVAIAPTPTLIAGLEVEGLGRLLVDGSILVNTEWGGVDENGAPAGVAPGPPYGVACMPILPLTRVRARDIRVAGGVDRANNYRPFPAGGADPLQANRLPVPDPLADLPVPSVASDPANVSATAQSPGHVVKVALPVAVAEQLLDNVLAVLSPALRSLFQPLVSPLTGLLTEQTLRPGVYESITVLAPLGGVTFEPGVYVVRGASVDTLLPLLIVGPVRAEGVLFYVTDSSSYDASTGLPDAIDNADEAPPNTVASTPPSVVLLPLLSGARITGLNDPGSPFHGMLIYQRRLDRRPIIIEAQQLLGSGDISGTIYSKWGHVSFVGGFGSYDLRFVCGTMRVVTVTDTTLAPSALLPPARDVLLLE